jgi:hypothetical protein
MNIAKKPTPGGSARLRSVRRQLFQIKLNCEQAAKRIRADVAATGKPQLETELAGDAAELDAAYAALKTLILALDPAADVPDLE